MGGYIGNYAETERILRKYDFVMRKKYGQNFLIDAGVLERIVEEAEITGDDLVLEVGPGIGTLTQYLAERAAHVTAVEIDPKLIPILAETLSSYPNAEVIHKDIMKVDIDALFSSYLVDGAWAEKVPKVVANLPYYITTPVLMKLLEGKTRFRKMLFMVQKEVADRITAAPGTEDYGALSLAAAYYAKITVAGTVPPSCFLPRPNVESALVVFDVYEEKPVQPKDEALMFKLIRASFNQRRKTLVNGLSHFEGLSVEKEKVKEVLEDMGLSLTVRGETLSLAQFAELSDRLM